MGQLRHYNSQFGYLANGQPRLQLPPRFWDDVAWQPEPEPREQDIPFECVRVRALAAYITNPDKGLIITRQTVSVWFSRYQDVWPGVYRVNGNLYVQRAIARQVKELLANSPELIYTRPGDKTLETIPGPLDTTGADMVKELTVRIEEHKSSNRDAFKRVRSAIKAIQDELRLGNRTIDANAADLHFCSRRLAAIENWLQTEFGFRPAEPEAGSPQ